MPKDKTEWRHWAIARRAGLDMPALSTMLLKRLDDLSLLQNAQHILIYSAMPNEVDVLPLAADSKRQWYLPRCAPNRRLALHAYVPEKTPFRTGPFGILEPDPKQVPEEIPLMLDAVIVPALLLTPDGGRLGYGGGYYDRFLPQLRSDCTTIGVLPEELIVPTLPLDSWDITLDRVITQNT